MLTSSVSGTVFNVVHGSFVDGWGIRTTVFLKGCPLRCLWCCNPESQHVQPELQIIAEHCSGCGRCLEKCPTHALSLVGDAIQVDRSRCDACGKCIKHCWPGALEIWGKTRTAEDVFAECLRDKSFYLESGGGVTLSGGEATLQPEFCLEMIQRCHEENIPVAIDTCGQITTEAGIEVLRQADLILFDIKGLDPIVHKNNTGVSNEIILKNLNLMDALGKDVIIRYPMIPHHNLEEASRIAEHLSSLTCIRRVDLIPYHQYGTGKYEQLGRTYPIHEDSIPEPEQKELLDLFSRKGLQTQLGG